MPDYVVTGPDGRQLRFTGPEAPSQAMIDQGFQKLPDPQQAWQKAQGIGPARVGERYLPTGGPMGILDVIRTALGGAQRPASVAAQDPYGIQAWEKGAGPMPVMIAGETQPLDRAKAMGFNVEEPVFHGSNRAFQTFEPKPTYRQSSEGDLIPTTSVAYFFSTDPATARVYANQRVQMASELLGQPGGKATVRKFVLKSQNPLDLTVSPTVRAQMTKDGFSPYYNPNGINPYGAQLLEQITGYAPETWNDVHSMLDDPDVIATLHEHGFDSVRLQEERLGGDTIAVFDPSQIRSVKAQFDKKKAYSTNIMASLAALLAAQRQPQGQP